MISSAHRNLQRTEIYFWFSDSKKSKDVGHVALRIFSGEINREGVYASIRPLRLKSTNMFDIFQYYCRVIFQVYKAEFLDYRLELENEKISKKPDKIVVLYDLDINSINQHFIKILSSEKTSYYFLSSAAFAEENGYRFNCVSLIEYLLEKGGLKIVKSDKIKSHSQLENGAAKAMGGSAIITCAGLVASIVNYQNNLIDSNIIQSYSKLLNPSSFFSLSTHEAYYRIGMVHSSQKKIIFSGSILAIAVIFAGLYYAIKLNRTSNKIILESMQPKNLFNFLNKVKQEEKKLENFQFFRRNAMFERCVKTNDALAGIAQRIIETHNTAKRAEEIAMEAQREAREAKEMAVAALAARDYAAIEQGFDMVKEVDKLKEDAESKSEQQSQSGAVITIEKAGDIRTEKANAVQTKVTINDAKATFGQMNDTYLHVPPDDIQGQLHEARTMTSIAVLVNFIKNDYIKRGICGGIFGFAASYKLGTNKPVTAAIGAALGAASKFLG